MNWFNRIFKKRKSMETTTIYVPRRWKVMDERFTNEELLAMMPEHKRVDREYMKGAIDFIMEKMPCYQDIDGYIKQCCSEAFPRPTNEQYRSRDEYCEEYRKYFYGDDYYKFSNAVQSEFLHRKGTRRSYEEACQIAADKWVEMIFGTHIQDNGDRTGGSEMAMMLGTIIKDEAQKRCKQEVPEKARELLKKFYLGGCMCKGSYGDFSCAPYSDYGPNTPLYDILVEAGVDGCDAGKITPWKTGIEIDENDNAVMLQGYQTLEYI